MIFKPDRDNPYSKKLKTPHYIKIFTPPDIWSHIYGLSSALGFIIAILALIYNYINQSQNSDFNSYNYILTTLTVLIAVVLLIFLLSVLSFNQRIKRLSQIPAKYSFYEQEFIKNDIIINQLCECSHIVTHYFRNLDFSLQEIIDKEESKITDNELIDVINKFDYFLINIITNLQSYFSQITDDNCSLTIKLLNYNDASSADDDIFIKTYFRDPVNFKRRRETDNLHPKCAVEDNTAFAIIMDQAYKNIYFAEDNLTDLYNRHMYKNPNPEWHKYYNSTLVVPISIVTGKNERIILGFLSVDNFKGGLANNSNKEYLFFIADLLYLAFNKFDRIIKFAQTKNITNEKIDRYSNWNQC
ncbi:hypothetical protein ACXYMT_13425 [Salinimicrobium sp. CAU 1759]